MNDQSLRLMLFVHAFLFALVVGVFWGTWFSLSRSMSADIAAAASFEVGHTDNGNLGGPMAVFTPAITLGINMSKSTMPSPRGRSTRCRPTGRAFAIDGRPYHAAHTFISLAGFGSALAAALWSREDAAPPV